MQCKVFFLSNQVHAAIRATDSSNAYRMMNHFLALSGAGGLLWTGLLMFPKGRIKRTQMNTKCIPDLSDRTKVLCKIHEVIISVNATNFIILCGLN